MPTKSNNAILISLEDTDYTEVWKHTLEAAALDPTIFERKNKETLAIVLSNLAFGVFMVRNYSSDINKRHLELYRRALTLSKYQVQLDDEVDEYLGIVPFDEDQPFTCFIYQNELKAHSY